MPHSRPPPPKKQSTPQGEIGAWVRKGVRAPGIEGTVNLYYNGFYCIDYADVSIRFVSRPLMDERLEQA